MGFITDIAGALYGRYGDEISSLCIVFPSRRAGVFFNDALAQVAAKPLWQPSFMSVDQIMEEAAGLTVVENEKLITELYKVYSQYHDETFDSFYFWGGMLLSDFDQIDKYLVDAEALFSNIVDLKQLDDFSFLSEDQREIVTRFWRNFDPKGRPSNEKTEFMRVWRTLAPIYKQYKEGLAAQGLAYSGMMHRAAADNIRNNTAAPGERKYIVAGFNALTACEKILFDHLRDTGQAEFFWDYDDYYIADANQEAGLFLRENIKRYPQAERFATDNFSRPKEITVVGAPSDSLQAKYVHDFLNQGVALDKRTAIVLTDENLLLPVLYSAAAVDTPINVTMGYPLRQSLAYSFVERLLELQSGARVRGSQTSFYHSHVLGLLSHPYIREEGELAAEIAKGRLIYVNERFLARTPLLEAIFKPGEGWREKAAYLTEVIALVAALRNDGSDRRERTEYFATMSEAIKRVAGSVENCGLELSDKVFISLLRRHLQSIRIPYEGEPLAGVQVMGILETRALDFENVVVLSVNDDTFPGNRMVSPSFIPYNLRGAYGLPDASHHEGVYGYYFYRLLQRAQKIDLVYCSTSDQRRTGEESRYIYQLRYESGHAISEKHIALDISCGEGETITVAKEGAAADVLRDFLEGRRRLSPTSFYAYVECPLKFYFRSVGGLDVERRLTEEIEAPMFGTILHKAMENLYKNLVGVASPETAIGSLIGSYEVEAAVENAIQSEYLAQMELSRDEFGGNLLLAKEVVVKYINSSVLPYDARGGFTIEALEMKLGLGVNFNGGQVQFYGVADRIDRTPEGVRIIDYKTGAADNQFKGIEALFSPKAKERSAAALQTLIYAMMASAAYGGNAQPALYYVRAMTSPDFSPLLYDLSQKEPIVSFEQYRKEFEPLLAAKLAEMFNFAAPFLQCEDSDTCLWCDYKRICKK